MDLEQDLLSLCKRALAEQRWDVADHLLAALETLSRTAPEAARSVEQAYLFVDPAGATSCLTERQPTGCRRRSIRSTMRASNRSPRERNR